jgi:hypothetical protein
MYGAGTVIFEAQLHSQFSFLICVFGALSYRIHQKNNALRDHAMRYQDSWNRVPSAENHVAFNVDIFW